MVLESGSDWSTSEGGLSADCDNWWGFNKRKFKEINIVSDLTSKGGDIKENLPNKKIKKEHICYIETTIGGPQAPCSILKHSLVND